MHPNVIQGGYLDNYAPMVALICIPPNHNTMIFQKTDTKLIPGVAQLTFIEQLVTWGMMSWSGITVGVLK